MAQKNYREESKKNWGTFDEGSLTIEQINCGAILRIADAVEKMAGNYTKLQDDYNYMRGNRDYYRSEWESLRRSNAALRGHIKRLKGKN